MKKSTPAAKRILVVDDEKVITKTLEHYFAKKKYKMFTAFDGNNAVNILKEGAIDLVLLDIMMPHLNGIEVLKTIRQKYPNTKVIIMTSYDAKYKQEAERLGVDGFFAKPFGVGALTKRIEEVLKAKGPTLAYPTKEKPLSKDGYIPKARILFIESNALSPYAFPILDCNEEKTGQFEYETAYCKKEAMAKLRLFKPDVVVLSAGIPEDRPRSHNVVPTGDLIDKILSSKYSPQEVILHGSPVELNSEKDATQRLEKLGGQAQVDAEGFPYSRASKQSAQKVSDMIIQACYKHNLVTKKKK
jgi:DNA-binding response OmpR family regulator